MLKDLSFGQYYPKNSFVHKMDARIKLLLTIFFIVTIFFAESYFSYLLLSVLIIGTILVSRLPILAILRSMKYIVMIVLLTTIINLFCIKEGQYLFNQHIVGSWYIGMTLGGVHTSAKLAIRLILLMLGASILSLTTTPMSLTDGMENLMFPLKLIKFPVHDIALIMSIALRFIPTLLEETTKIMNAQKARGAEFDTGGILKRAKAMLPILIPLFVSSFRRADELAYALDARCYNATDKRTKMKVQKVGWRDLIGALTTVAFFAMIFVDKYHFGGLDTIIFGLVY